MFHGKKVKIRPLEVSDATDLKRLNEDPAVRGNVVGWALPNSETELTEWLKRAADGRTVRWAVTDLMDDTFIGLSGLWNIDWHNRNAETALKLGGREGLRGRGLGTDAIMIAMAIAFYDVGIHRLYTTILETNTASRKAYIDKCGWQEEGTSREQVWRHGAYRNLIHIGILKDEFDSLPDADEYRALIQGDAPS
jgi:RimJ/RimL family protein N-acetyltransferase